LVDIENMLDYLHVNTDYYPAFIEFCNNMEIRIKEKTITNSQKVFSTFPEVEMAIFYCSRTKGTFKPASDIDISLVGKKLNLQILNQRE
jgi:predicted nucleotidyltransferase